MAPAISINLFAIVSLALFSISLSPIAANAVSLEQAHVARNLHHAHAGVAKKKRDGPAKRCKPRPTSSTPTPSNTPANTPPSNPSPSDTTSSTNTPYASPSPTPTTSSSSSPSPTSTPTSGSTVGKVGISWSNNEETSLCNFASPSTSMCVFLPHLRLELSLTFSQCVQLGLSRIWLHCQSLVVRSYLRTDVS